MYNIHQKKSNLLFDTNVIQALAARYKELEVVSVENYNRLSDEGGY